jgi:hypothetical protein
VFWIALDVDGALVTIEAGVHDGAAANGTVRADGFGFPCAFKFKLLRVGFNRLKIETQSTEGHTNRCRAG